MARNSNDEFLVFLVVCRCRHVLVNLLYAGCGQGFSLRSRFLRALPRNFTWSTVMDVPWVNGAGLDGVPFDANPRAARGKRATLGRVVCGMAFEDCHVGNVRRGVGFYAVRRFQGALVFRVLRRCDRFRVKVGVARAFHRGFHFKASRDEIGNQGLAVGVAKLRGIYVRCYRATCSYAAGRLNDVHPGSAWACRRRVDIARTFRLVFSRRRLHALLPLCVGFIRRLSWAVYEAVFLRCRVLIFPVTHRNRGAGRSLTSHPLASPSARSAGYC